MRHLIARLAFATALALPGLAGAMGLPPASGPVVLTVTGAIGQTNAEGAAEFDLAMLDGLAGRDTVTKTPWHEGAKRFSGPLLSAVLEAVGASGSTIRLTAINDYAVDMPVTDAETIPVILATRIDGKALSIRDKGPLFVIYPFDERPDLYNEMYFGRSVWQVTRLEVRAE